MTSIPERIRSIFPDPSSIPAPHRLPGRLEQREYLVDGVIRTWNGPLVEVTSCICSPNGRPLPIGAYPALTADEALGAVDAAARAFDRGRGGWPTLPVAERIRHLEDFAGQMRERRAEVVRLLMWEIGKSFQDSGKEFDRTVEYIIDTVEALKEVDRVSSRFVLQEGVTAQIRRAPLGVVLCMGPYNYPLNETFTTLIPALVMGNTVVFKPAGFGVLLLRPLLEAFRDTFPPGVVNTVYGDGPTIIGPIMQSGRVDCLAFIGSSRVADVLKRQHPAPHRLRSALGLGAKNAGIILPDADLEVTVSECVLGSLSYNGQRCTALKILFVHESIVDEFLPRLVAAVEALPFGMPWEDDVRITPLPVPGKPAELATWIQEAVAAGAKVLNQEGGAANSTYLHPSVVYPVAPGTRLHRLEQFGPIVPVVSFRDIAEPIEYVVGSPYGQQVSLFGRDSRLLAGLIDPLVNQVCRVNLNSQCQRGPDAFPFTGRKDSAEGVLSVSDALKIFSIRTLVAAKGGPLNNAILTRMVRNRESSFLSTDFIL
jgi:glyceraldehyde-3-phosphate dehydrogenase (NADP+)